MRFSSKPMETRGQNEWGVKSLTTYLVHVLHEKFNSVVLSVFLQVFS